MEKINGQYTFDQAYDLARFVCGTPPIEASVFDGNDMDDETYKLSKNKSIVPFLVPGYKGHKTILILNEDENYFPGFCIIYPEIEESEENKYDLYFSKKVNIESFDRLVIDMNYIRDKIENKYDSIRIIPSLDLTSEDISKSLFINHYYNGMEYTLISSEYNKDLQIGNVLKKQ